MPSTPAISSWRWFSAAIIALAGLGAAAVLYFFNPTDYSFYPVCPLHHLTGLQCPGCGSLRALHQLLHGHIVAAFHFNPLLILLLPVAGWLGAREIVRELTGRQLPGIVTRPACGWIITAAVILFGILRNVPFFR